MAYITDKQYPTVQQMVGLFQGLAQQQLEREKFEADKKHQKQYGKYLAGKLKVEEQEAELLKAQQEALSNYRASQQMIEIMKQQAAARKEQSALAETAIDLVNKRLGTEYANLPPGSTMKDEKFTELYGSLWQQLTALGLPAQEAGQILSSIPVLSKPDEEASLGSKLNFAAQFPGFVTGGLKDDIEKALGIAITDDMLKGLSTLPYESKLLASKYLTGYAEGRGNVKDLPEVVRLLREGNMLELVTNFPLEPELTGSTLPVGISTMFFGPEGIFQKGVSSREQADAMCRELNLLEAERGSGVRYKVQRKDIPARVGGGVGAIVGDALGLENYTLVEDIPTDLESTWHTLNDRTKRSVRGLESVWIDLSAEEKKTAITLINQGYSSQEIIDALVEEGKFGGTGATGNW